MPWNKKTSRTNGKRTFVSLASLEFTAASEPPAAPLCSPLAALLLEAFERGTEKK
jgi:hypothetical protein